MEGLYLGHIYTTPLALLVFFYQLWSLYVIYWFPSVVTFWVTLPLYEVLQLSFLPMTSVASDGLNLVLFLVIDKVRWGSGVILPVFFCLYKWGKEGCVKHGVYCPLRR